jgi:biotin carboxyl carrier protein
MKVVAEVAGKVWKIEVRPGAQVALDDAILILESMKMEIPVLAPRAGTLVELHVVEGEAVAEGQLIAVLAA